MFGLCGQERPFYSIYSVADNDCCRTSDTCTTFLSANFFGMADASVWFPLTMHKDIFPRELEQDLHVFLCQ